MDRIWAVGQNQNKIGDRVDSVALAGSRIRFGSDKSNYIGDPALGLHSNWDMLERFKAFQMAKAFYKQSKAIDLPLYAKEQLIRASLSIGCNLAEGSGKLNSQKDQLRFYCIALGSLRECQSILSFECADNTEIIKAADELAACIYKLCQSKMTKPKR